MKTMSCVVRIIFIGLITVHAIVLHEAQAKQSRSDLLNSKPSFILSEEKLKSQRVSVERSSEIGEKIKTDSLNYIDQAISFMDAARLIQQRSKELSLTVDSAPARQKTLQNMMKEILNATGKIESVNSKISTVELEQLFRQNETEYTNAQINLKKWDNKLIAEQALLNQASEQIVNATHRLKQIQTDLNQFSDTTDRDLPNYYKMISLHAEQEMLRAKINLNEQRQLNHNLVIELYRAERNVALRTVEYHETIFQSLSEKIQDRRQAEAFQTVVDAKDAVRKASLEPEIIQDQFDININLSTELEKITREEADLAEKNNKYKVRLKLLEGELETAEKRVDLDILTDAIGMALRNQRRNLPSINQYDADSETHQIRMSEISERQIFLDRLLREISTQDTLKNDLISTRWDIIQKMKSGYDRIIRLIQDIEFSKKRLIITAQNFRELLDRHLLWIRSSKPVSFNEISNLKNVLLKTVSSRYWQNRITEIKISLRQNPGYWIVGIGAAFFLVFTGKWARKKLKKISEDIDLQTNDSLLPTVQAIGLSVILSVVWPYLLVVPVISLSTWSQTAEISGNPIYYCWIMIFWILIYNICRPFGLAQKHFHWPESVRRTLTFHLAWLIPVEILSMYLLLLMETTIEYDYRQSLGKLAIIIQCLALSLFAAIVLRFKKGITATLIEKYPHTVLCRMRYVWYTFFIVTPLYIFWLTTAGYYYSAFEIRYLFYKTIALFVILIIFKNLAIRILVLARRNIALKKAVLNQQVNAEKEILSDPDPNAKAAGLSIMETFVKLNDIDEKNRSFLKMIIIVLGLMGTWTIWEPVFPAFGILQDVQLWSYITVLNGVEQTVPITLANIVLAVIVIMTMFIAVRNLPGLIEVFLLNRLSIDAGARYAYITVSRYIITALGFFIVLNSIGIRWSNLQWLVAALSVGLGFGLQEIVANFVSGLIVLFERPFRVGDTITVGDVSGTVTRIKIRATTILDWDRKELIVPNKDFITGKIINWSLTDRIIRIKVPIGIAYGSDTDLAEQLLLKVAKNNALVIKSPQPNVVFLRFGDNSLDYEVRVFIKSIDDWIPMLHKMNQAINKEFNENGISIAFPQRDVHLDMAEPLSVRVVSKQTIHNAMEPES